MNNVIGSGDLVSSHVRRSRIIDSRASPVTGARIPYTSLLLFVLRPSKNEDETMRRKPALRPTDLYIVPEFV